MNDYRNYQRQTQGKRLSKWNSKNSGSRKSFSKHKVVTKEQFLRQETAKQSLIAQQRAQRKNPISSITRHEIYSALTPRQSTRDTKSLHKLARKNSISGIIIYNCILFCNEYCFDLVLVYCITDFLHDLLLS